ncbi:disulfide bond formation protein DsbB [Photobacterium swingsii]|uniref:disulfide bond formation protein DsbB n=1 Tax=Photobacterium swingsii TaxID=680026 RepID=UPI004068EB52
MQFLYSFSKRRSSWLLLLAFILFFEASALFFQHGMKLPPCVMCIYERVAMFGIAIAALVGLSAPHNPVIRWLGLAGWGYSAYEGLMLSIKHVDYQLNPSPFNTCDLFVQFPSWAPLNQWLPGVFEAYGDCGKVVWMFMEQTMPQWLVIIFGANLVALAIIVIAQLVGIKAKKEA